MQMRDDSTVQPGQVRRCRLWILSKCKLMPDEEVYGEAACGELRRRDGRLWTEVAES